MKKNNQYYKSKRKILKRKAPNIDALKLFMQGVLAGVGMARHMVVPTPKYQSGGKTDRISGIVGETGSELIVRDDTIIMKECEKFTYLKPGTRIISNEDLKGFALMDGKQGDLKYPVGWSENIINTLKNKPTK